MRGCINDVENMADVLKTKLNFDTTSYTDKDTPSMTTKVGIVSALYQLAVQTWKEEVDTVWIHYSGHGSYVQDNTRSRDEADGCDECLVPSDYETSGVILDDDIHQIFTSFHPETRVVCVFDCCHSGTIGDLPYRWRNEWEVSLANRKFDIPANVLTLSGCRDDQTSADAFSVVNRNEYEGALSGCLQIALDTCESNVDVFVLLGIIRSSLRKRKFPQYPVLGSNYNLRASPKLVS